MDELLRFAMSFTHAERVQFMSLVACSMIICSFTVPWAYASRGPRRRVDIDNRRTVRISNGRRDVEPTSRRDPPAVQLEADNRAEVDR